MLIWLVKVLIFTACLNKFGCTQDVEKKFHNYTLFRSIPVNDKHLNFLRNLSNTYDVDYWRGPGDHLYRPTEFVIPPQQKTAFLRDAEVRGIYVTTVIEDIQSAFDAQVVRSYIRRNTESFNWQSYYGVNDIYNWLADLSNIHKNVMSVESIGTSHLGRDILAVRISHPGSKKRSKVIVEGCIHAREWISPAFVTYMIHQILHAPTSRNSELRTIALTYEWFFVPVLNPDGYEISHTKNRMWRKNSRGVDLNRNFGVAFGTVGISFNPTSDTYCGKGAFSEPESTAMANFITSKSKDLEYYLAFHSYGQYMILPYTHSTKHRENFDTVKKMCEKAAAEIYKRYKTPYTIGTAYDTVGYMTSGVSGCWTKINYHVPYVVTFELRDNGRYGFALPEKQIIPTCQETMDGVLSLLTPRRNFQAEKKLKGSQEKVFLDWCILIWNFVLFIIVRF